MFASFNNVIDEKTIKRNLLSALEDLDEILVHHAGPFATNAILGSKWRQHNDIDEFTKDGIKILRYAIVDNDPMARLMARFARNIGISVDSRCHDGTTTSMLTFCRLAILAITYMDDPILSSQNRQRLLRCLVSGLELCRDTIQRVKITDEDLANKAHDLGISTSIEDVRSALAYHMAMVSSKGNHDLSFKISEVIRTTPSHIQGIFAKVPTGIETEEKYILEKQDFDLRIFANLGDLNDYNFKLGSQYKSEDAVIFATGNEIISASLESYWLRAFISSNPRKRANLADFGTEFGWEHYHQKKRNLVILTPLMQDTELMADIKEFNIQNPHFRISYFNTQTPPQLKTSFYNTIHYMAGKPLFSNTMALDPTTTLIGLDKPVKVHLVGHTLYIRDLYEREEGEVFHRLYRQPDEMPEYTAFVKECEELITFASDNSSNRALDPDQIALLTSWYRCLTCQDIYDIKIGGSTHDQYSNQTVYEDAIGSALSALKEGVVLGGYAHLAHALSGRDRSLCDRKDSVFHEAMSVIFSGIVEDSMRVKSLSPAWYPEDKWNYVVADPDQYVQQSSWWRSLLGMERDSHVVYRELDYDGMIHFLRREPGTPILFQAWAGYDEQLKRFMDILPRLVNTTRLVDMRMDDAQDVG